MWVVGGGFFCCLFVFLELEGAFSYIQKGPEEHWCLPDCHRGIHILVPVAQHLRLSCPSKTHKFIVQHHTHA